MSGTPDSDSVLLAGLDFGSTTSCMLVARARWRKSDATGRVQLDEPRLVFSSTPVLTPFHDGSGGIDEDQVAAMIDGWVEDASIDLKRIFAGGVIITGLAAERRNAATLAELTGERFGGMVVATADDPGLESWLAFMGNCSRLSVEHPDRTLLNLDIGGGTTNSAIGLAGNVLRVGCHAIGARHFQFVPGTFELTRMSATGERVLSRLGIEAGPGDDLTEEDVDRLVGHSVRALEALVLNRPEHFEDEAFEMLSQRPLEWDGDPASVITFSGGVGELLYRATGGRDLPGRTAFGDLGVELARGILSSGTLCADLKTWRPEGLGRATVYGLSLHATELSGSTLYLPDPAILPLRDLPIVARLPLDAPQSSLDDAIGIAGTHPQGAGLQLLMQGAQPPGRAMLKDFAGRLQNSFDGIGERFDRPLVLLCEGNIGKSVGHYVTAWGQRSDQLVVIDEVPDRHAHFVNVGQMRDGVVPVCCYGIG